MLISKKNKFIFFHIPKVAGSSITKALRKYSDYPSERVYNYFIDYLGVQPMLNLYSRHIKPAELRAKMKNKRNFDLFFKFAFVRNTWDWHVSQFMYHKQKSDAFFHSDFNNMTFSDYVDWAIQPDNITKANARQKYFLSDLEGDLMVDFIGRHDSLISDFDFIKKKIGVKATIKIYNTSKRNKDYKSYYNDRDAEKIAQTFKEDIEYFGFKF